MWISHYISWISTWHIFLTNIYLSTTIIRQHKTTSAWSMRWCLIMKATILYLHLFRQGLDDDAATCYNVYLLNANCTRFSSRSRRYAKTTWDLLWVSYFVTRYDLFHCLTQHYAMHSVFGSEVCIGKYFLLRVPHGRGWTVEQLYTTVCGAGCTY